jgi:hypothetical protein
MTPSHRRPAPRTGLALVGILTILASLATLTPMVPGVRAVDPTPDPSVGVSPDPGPTPTTIPDPTTAPTPDPTPDPTSTPAPDPSTDPTVEPSAEPSPAASFEPSVEPSVDPSAEPSPAASVEPSVEPSVDPSGEPSPAASVEPAGLEVQHTWIDTLDALGEVAAAGSADAALDRMERFVVYRVRFQVVNSGMADIQLSPLLEVGTGANPDAWTQVPEVNPAADVPFYAASDDGRVFRVRSSGIAPSELRSDTGPGPAVQPMAGVSSAGLNPAPSITLPAGTFTEVEFSVRATVNAGWMQSYAFRLRPAAETVAAGTPVVVTMRAKPQIVLTVPASATSATGNTVRYQLALAVLNPATGPAYRLAAYVDPSSPHVISSLTSDTCAVCHATHRATSTPLLSSVYRTDPLRSAQEPYDGADFGLCLSCHQESPFADESGSANPLTSFPGHGYHLGHIQENGAGGDNITIPGDGLGNALCAECHYNLHAVKTSERGLVVFAPDVLPFNGQLVYDAANGSCTLTCHGRPHDGMTFQTSTPGA